jgi:hypothetical protein
MKAYGRGIFTQSRKDEIILNFYCGGGIITIVF